MCVLGGRETCVERREGVGVGCRGGRPAWSTPISCSPRVRDPLAYSPCGMVGDKGRGVRNNERRGVRGMGRSRRFVN